MSHLSVLDPLLKRLLALPRWTRRFIIVLADLVALVAAGWAGFSIRTGAAQVDLAPFGLLLILSVGCWILASLIVDPYRSTIRFTGRQTIYILLKACMVMMVMLTFLLFIIRPPDVPRTLSLLLPLLFFCFASTNRVLASVLLQPLLDDGDERSAHKRVLVYGNGAVMQQMALAIRREPRLNLVGVIDQTSKDRDILLEDMPIMGDDRLEDILADGQIDDLYLAYSGDRQRAVRRALVERLEKAKIHVNVRVLPSISDVAFDKVSITDMREIDIADLLGRDAVEPDPELFHRNIAGCDVLVTGAGGSIGSELVRQIVRTGPRRLYLVDQSEFHLYAIEEEIKSLCARFGYAVDIIPELANVADPIDCARVFNSARPDTVFHAAAYKHVPLVEQNVSAGVRNNVQGTLNCCLEAERCKTNTFILVSTDKAVRPTSVMGASKRVCEMIVQARAALRSGPRYSAVRFGNVLGSSGSVVPRFREQIAAGGPVTITHRDITRYFMTIPEAAQLVIQAGAMAEGGEIYLLDMGEPVRIIDLAHAMIRLSGLEVRDADNPDGDIEIVEIGLRDGEKLYEELLIGENPLPTAHDRIVKGHEEMMAWDELKAHLDRLSGEIAADNDEAVRASLCTLVPGYCPSGTTA